MVEIKVHHYAMACCPTGFHQARRKKSWARSPGGKTVQIDSRRCFGEKTSMGVGMTRLIYTCSQWDL